MIKIKIDRGWWVNGRKMETLYHEYCSNPLCSAPRLHYPDHLTDANCPECRTKLKGIGFMEGYGKRIAYHLEA